MEECVGAVRTLTSRKTTRVSRSDILIAGRFTASRHSIAGE